MQKIKNMIVNSRVWRSFFRHGWPDNPLDRSLIMTTNVFFHLHPVKVSKKSLKWTYSMGLGLITAIVFGSLAITIMRHPSNEHTPISPSCKQKCLSANCCATCTVGVRT